MINIFRRDCAVQSFSITLKKLSTRPLNDASVNDLRRRASRFVLPPVVFGILLVTAVSAAANTAIPDAFQGIWTLSADCAAGPDKLYISSTSYEIAEVKCLLSNWSQTTNGIKINARCSGHGFAPYDEFRVLEWGQNGNLLTEFAYASGQPRTYVEPGTLGRCVKKGHKDGYDLYEHPADSDPTNSNAVWSYEPERAALIIAGEPIYNAVKSGRRDATCNNQFCGTHPEAFHCDHSEFLNGHRTQLCHVIVNLAQGRIMQARAVDIYNGQIVERLGQCLKGCSLPDDLSGREPTLRDLEKGSVSGATRPRTPSGN